MTRARRWMVLAAAVGVVAGLAVARLPGRSARAVKRAVATAEADQSLQDTRYIDMGVVLRVVRMDLEGGAELVEGAPPMAVVREHRLGGTVDTWGDRPRMCGPSRDPVIWHCSEDAAPIILHGEELPDRLLVYGSEGAGKTRVLAQWVGVRGIEATGTNHIIGITSPTDPRAEEIREAIREMWPPHWFLWRARLREYRLHNGVRVHIRSTYQQSRKAGSRVQGFNWRAAAGDEIQDSLEADPDIEMRGRKAPFGRFKRLCTATSKDSSAFREWRDKRLTGTPEEPPLWKKCMLLGQRSPFLWPRFWEEKARTLDKREYRRRVLAEDLPPENRVYYGFERTTEINGVLVPKNLVPLPEVARDISHEVLGIFRPIRHRHGAFALLAGHDPGEIRNVTTFLRPYFHRDTILWLVVGRFITERTTAEAHAAALRRHVQKTYGLNYDVDPRDPQAGARLLVMCDPHGRGESKTDYATVYQAFIDAGLDCFNAAGSDEVIKGRARREMMNRLLDPEVGPPRLAVAVDRAGDAMAPELVKAFEELERDDRGVAEKDRKNELDQTHHPVSVGYALWPFEQPAMAAATRTRVLKLLRGVA